MAADIETLFETAEPVVYFRVNRYAQTVSYQPTHDAEVFVAKAHDWLPEFNVEDSNGRIIGRRKSVAGVLRLLVQLADKSVA